jgi:uncharacterized protein (TIGR00290 family)
MTEPVVLSFSGGKDSVLALARLRAARPAPPVILLTSVTRTYGRVSIHGVRHRLLRAQARALAAPLELLALPAECPNALYEERFGRRLGRYASRGIRTIAFGDLFLADVRAYRERLVTARGLEARFPLWGEDTARLARDFLASGHRAIVVAVDTARLPASAAGREYDARFLAELPPDVDPCGENGEFHTFVYAGPGFRSPVAVRRGATVHRDGRFVFRDLLAATDTDADEAEDRSPALPLQ